MANVSHTALQSKSNFVHVCQSRKFFGVVLGSFTRLKLWQIEFCQYISSSLAYINE